MFNLIWTLYLADDLSSPQEDDYGKVTTNFDREASPPYAGEQNVEQSSQQKDPQADLLPAHTSSLEYH